MKNLTVNELFSELGQKLSLTWLAGQNGGDRSIEKNSETHRPNLLGLLDLISPNRIQLIGKAEFAGMSRLSGSVQQELFQQNSQLIIIADDVAPGNDLIELATQTSTPLFTSPLPCRRLINTIGQYLTTRLSDTVIIHGVLMEVLGVGVLITGESSVGKSELALELITRGHKLVADDAPEFRRIAHNTIEGSCPRLLRDFLEVRGLGVINIRKMYGHASTRHKKILRFIVRLELMDESNPFDDSSRLNRTEQIRDVLGLEISELTIPVAPGRNLAVLVEAAVRNYLLEKSGYDSSQEFENLQRHLMES
ncbi:HPr(Ser) kinase/phosphatase [Chromatiales bacterium (ex Bugula neritina AB1)]|nr:HPr(Ser) kinase/phosphatase [Chromatiales bacterium (ex Bugula neritina AB1)]